MARMHTRKRGKSGSNHPLREGKPSWVSMKESDVEDLVIRLRREGFTKSRIGMIIRDQYGIPKVKEVTGKRISSILENNGIKDQIPEDLEALINKASNLSKHLASNPRDLKNRRGLELIEAKIKRLSDYYKRKNVLQPGWSYARSEAEITSK
ncbi:MAG: 30S ribosomal protein S15 [Thermoplasmatales archaeon]